MSVAHWAHGALPDHELPGLSPEEYVIFFRDP